MLDRICFWLASRIAPKGFCVRPSYNSYAALLDHKTGEARVQTWGNFPDNGHEYVLRS